MKKLVLLTKIWLYAMWPTCNFCGCYAETIALSDSLFTCQLMYEKTCCWLELLIIRETINSMPDMLQYLNFMYMSFNSHNIHVYKVYQKKKKIYNWRQRKSLKNLTESSLQPPSSICDNSIIIVRISDISKNKHKFVLYYS